MVRIKFIYEENMCKAFVEESNPYLILNLEEFVYRRGISSTSHCDFLYIMGNNSGTYNIYLVELKDVDCETDIDKIISHISKFLVNKLPQTKQLVSDLIDFLRIGNVNYYGILVLPECVISKLYEHYSIISKKIKLNFENSWISACNNDVNILNISNVLYNRMFP